MSTPFCENHPQIAVETGTVLENLPIAEDTFRLKLSTQRIHTRARPGQFVMLRLPRCKDPLLGRPLAVYRISDRGELEVVYLVVGKMTSRLTEVRAGDTLEIWGPLGNGFAASVSDFDRLIMVAGGIGHTPFLMLGKEFQEKNGPHSAVLLFGSRNQRRFSCIEDFQRAGISVFLASDDGSVGHRGPITDLIAGVYRRFCEEESARRVKMVCCGPGPMLQSAFLNAQKLEIPCDVSLESPMSCGLGICFTCVVETKPEPESESYEYLRTCVQGPVFDAYRLKW